MIGSVQPILVEGPGTGHADNFAPVAIAGGTRGQSGHALITGADNNQLRAVWA